MKEHLLAGAAMVDVTPDRLEMNQGIWIAGFGRGRKATEIHDRIWARSLVLESGGTKIAFCSVDVVGLFYEDVCEIRELVAQSGIALDSVWIAATHNHEGPDTMGLWGEDKTRSGVNREYVKRLKTQIAHSIIEAYRAERPAYMRLARNLAPGVSQDVREPWFLDEEILCLQVASVQHGGILATMVNYANHPEVLGPKNTEISSDFPHFLRQEIERAWGGIALYFTGAIGGMAVPRKPHAYEADNDGYLPLRKSETAGALRTFPAQMDFLSAKSIGVYLAKRAGAVLARSDWEPGEVNLSVLTREIRVPLSNALFIWAIDSGVFPSRTLYRERGAQFLRSEVSLVQVGRAAFVSVPGELFPELGVLVKEKLPGEYRFLIGLANDEVGYLIPKRNPFTSLLDYYQPRSTSRPGKRGHLEELLCPHPDAAELFVGVVEELGTLASKQQWRQQNESHPLVGNRT